jgi:hypothetical protein
MQLLALLLVSAIFAIKKYDDQGNLISLTIKKRGAKEEPASSSSSSSSSSISSRPEIPSKKIPTAVPKPESKYVTVIPAPSVQPSQQFGYGQHMPGQFMPNQYMPGQFMPNQYMPGQFMPNQYMPGQFMQAQVADCPTQLKQALLERDIARNEVITLNNTITILYAQLQQTQLVFQQLQGAQAPQPVQPTQENQQLYFNPNFQYVPYPAFQPAEPVQPTQPTQARFERQDFTVKKGDQVMINTKLEGDYTSMARPKN